MIRIERLSGRSVAGFRWVPGSGPLLPVFRHLLCQIGKGPPPLNLSGIVDPPCLRGDRLLGRALGADAARPAHRTAGRRRSRGARRPAGGLPARDRTYCPSLRDRLATLDPVATREDPGGCEEEAPPRSLHATCAKSSRLC